MHLAHRIFKPAAIVTSNPAYYDSYRIAGDIFQQLHQSDSAIAMYTKALTLEIATQEERKAIAEKLGRLQKKR